MGKGTSGKELSRTMMVDGEMKLGGRKKVKLEGGATTRKVEVGLDDVVEVRLAALDMRRKQRRREVGYLEVTIETEEGRVVELAEEQPIAKEVEEVTEPEVERLVIELRKVREATGELDFAIVEDKNREVAIIVRTFEMDTANALERIIVKGVDDVMERELGAELALEAEEEGVFEEERGMGRRRLKVGEADGVEGVVRGVSRDATHSLPQRRGDGRKHRAQALEPQKAKMVI